jgi:hypothetical protein
VGIESRSDRGQLIQVRAAAVSAAGLVISVDVIMGLSWWDAGGLRGIESRSDRGQVIQVPSCGGVALHAW